MLHFLSFSSFLRNLKRDFGFTLFTFINLHKIVMLGGGGGVTESSCDSVIEHFG